MPRDPYRIRRILGLVRMYWEKHPELRLGQLVMNLTPLTKTDCYNVEDDKLEVMLRRALELKE